MTDVRAKLIAYPRSKFPLRMMMFDPSGDLVFDTGEVSGMTAIEIPGLGAGSVRYTVTTFADGEVLLSDDPTCSGTVNYASDDMQVLGRLMHFIQIVQEAGRWFIEQGSSLANDLPEDSELDELRGFLESQASLGERFLEGAEVTRKMLEDAVKDE